MIFNRTPVFPVNPHRYKMNRAIRRERSAGNRTGLGCRPQGSVLALVMLWPCPKRSVEWTRGKMMVFSSQSCCEHQKNIEEAQDLINYKCNASVRQGVTLRAEPVGHGHTHTHIHRQLRKFTTDRPGLRELIKKCSLRKKKIFWRTLWSKMP